MRSRWIMPLLVALIACAELVLHELRYLVGYGADAGVALAAQGHGYLGFASLAVGVVLAGAIGRLLIAFRRALRTATAHPVPPFGLLWLASISALLAIYASQELLEGFLSTGHADGLAALAANDGWSAIPLAVGLGAVVALVLRGAAAAESVLAAHAHRRTAGPPARAPHIRRCPASPRIRLAPLAALGAGRAPPVPVA